ncbi:MAG: hypothetical protein ACPLX7_09700 [Candidatus Kapaibacteriota bacterium]|jgi:hypothetical protein
MDSTLLQILGATFGTLISIFTMLYKIRKEIVRQQKEIFEARLTDERRLLALENRITLVEQQTLSNIATLNQRLFELNQRFDMFYDILYKQKAKCYENE